MILRHGPGWAAQRLEFHARRLLRSDQPGERTTAEAISIILAQRSRFLTEKFGPSRDFSREINRGAQAKDGTAERSALPREEPELNPSPLRTQAEKARDPETVARIVDRVAQALEQVYVSESGVQLDVNPPWLPFRKQARAVIEAMPDTLLLIEALEGAEKTLKRMREGWANTIELNIIAPQHVGSASILRDEAETALDQIRKLTHD